MKAIERAIIKAEKAYEKGVCQSCGTEIRRASEPVTIGGWYGDANFQWVGLPHQTRRLCVVDCLCVNCRDLH